jgi:8-oxo-dGTP pyrophosphatase MutT (NUDIX family)
MNDSVASPRAALPAEEAPPRDAASVVLLRDGPSGLEVLLQRRHPDARVLGGWYVFPGGKLDEADCDTGQAACLDLSADQIHARLHEPLTPASRAMGLYVAALRELWEEAAIDLRGQASALQPWSRWITPKNPPVGSHRFDTRFFLALMPAGQTAKHDHHETIDTLWLNPRDALERYWQRDIELIPPQLMALAQLARHGDTRAAWQEAGQRRPPCIEPVHFMDGPHRAMCYPGDALHPVSERALPGPTRLRMVDRRFEPFEGFGGWFQ